MSNSEDAPATEPNAAPPNREGPIALWRIGEHFLRSLFMLFGDPGEVAALSMVTTKTHALMARWIAAGEALMRRLLLIEAQFVKVEPGKPCKPHERVRRRVEFHPEAPQDWRVSFHTSPARAPARAPQAQTEGVARAEPAPASRFRSVWPLALRFEALLRAFNDPAPYARRLARRLARAPAWRERCRKIRAELRPLIGEDELARIDAYEPACASADSS